MFSLDSVLDDLWPQARPAPGKKSVKRLLHEDEFQQFAASHRHLKGLDMVEQVLEHLDILCTISARDLEQIPEHGPLIVIANHPTGTWMGWRYCTPFRACAGTSRLSPTGCCLTLSPSARCLSPWTIWAAEPQKHLWCRWSSTCKTPAC